MWSPNSLVVYGLMRMFILLWNRAPMIAVLLIQLALIYLQGSKTPLAVAKLRETAKHRKYDAQAAKERIKFYPFVMETFGGVGKEAVAFIKKISNLHYEHSPVPVHRNALSSFIFRSLSIILQRGNALVQLMAAQYAREWAGGQCGY